MADQNKIDLVVSQGVFEQLTQLTTALNTADTALKSTIATFNSVKSASPNSLSGYKNAIQEQTEYQNSLKKTSDEVAKARVAEIKLQQAREKAVDNYNKKEQQAQAQATALAEKESLKRLQIAQKEKEQEIALAKAKLAMISSLNKQRYTEEEKQMQAHDKALLFSKEEELKQIRAKQAMISSLGAQRQKEEQQAIAQANKLAKETEREAQSAQKAALANEKLNSAYNKLNTARTEAKNKLRDLIVTQGASTAEVKKAQREFDILDKKVRKADRAVGDMSKGMVHTKGILMDLMMAFGVFSGIQIAFEIGKNIFNTTKELQSLDLALKNVSGSQEAFANGQAFLSGIAQSYGIEIKGLTKNYTDFLAASKGLLSQEKIEQIFTSVSKSAAAMGLSVESTDSAFLALEQMMSKGTIQAEELKKQLGNSLPGAMRAAAMAYMELHPEITKVADAERIVLSEMKKGAIDSATYIPLIVKQFEKLYGIENVNRIDTIQSSVNRLSNSWVNFVKSLNEANSSGFSRFINGIIETLTTFSDFTALLFKNENQLSDYFQKLGKAQGLSNFQSVMKNIANTSKENIKATKEEMMYRELANMKADQAIIKAEKLKRASFTGGDRAFMHLQTKAEEDALVRLGKSAEIIKQLKSYTGETPKIIKGETPEQKKKRLEAEEEARKAQEKAIKDKQAEDEKNAKISYDLLISNLEVEKRVAEDKIELAKSVTQNKEIQMQDVIDATNYYNGVLLTIERAKYNEEVRLAKENGSLITIATNKWNMSMLDLVTKNSQAMLQIIKDYKKDGGKVAEKMLSDLEESLKKFDEINNKFKNLKEDSAKARMKAFNEFGGQFADKLGFGDSFTLFGQEKDGKSLFKTMIGGEAENKDYALAAITLAQDTFNFIDQLSQEKYDRELVRLEEQYKLASSYANGNADAQKKLDEDYAKRKQKIAEKEFKHKQKMTIVNIAMDTAQAIMAVSGEGQPWMVPVMIALGDAQIAMVAAQKLPAYAEGVIGHEGGLALVNDGKGSNYNETIVTPDGKVIQPKGRNVIMDLPKGSDVFTKEQWDNQLTKMEQEGLKYSNVNVNTGLTFEEMDMLLAKHIASQTTNLTTMDSAGFNQAIIKNGNITRRTNSRANGVGQIFS